MTLKTYILLYIQNNERNNSEKINAESGFEPASKNECHSGALAFDVSHSWFSMAVEVLSIIIHGIIAVA